MALSALAVFCKVVELGSFRKAALALGIPVATASHQIQVLERRLNVKLLIRTTRKVDVTEDGQIYYQRIAPLLAGIEEAEQSLLSNSQEPKGQLNISAPASVVRTLIAPHLRSFTDAYPAVSLRIVATDTIVDLLEEGLDCVIRAGPTSANGLAVRSLGVMPQWFAASPFLIQQWGVPNTPAELARLPFINFAARHDVNLVKIDAYSGSRQERFFATAKISVNDGDSYVALAVQGLGVVMSPPYDLLPHIRSGELQILLSDWNGPNIHMHAVYARGRQLLPRVRVFVDWIERQFRQSAELPPNQLGEPSARAAPSSAGDCADVITQTGMSAR